MLLQSPLPRPKRGKPFKDKPIRIPNNQDLNLFEQDRNKQAEYVRKDAYTISRLLGKNILTALRDNDKQGMKENVISFGICADKVLSGVENSGIDLHVPAALVDKIVLALNVKQIAPLPVDIQQLP